MIVIHVIRKPCSEGSVGRNALKYGTGGINVDGSRIGTDEDFSDIKSRAAMKLNSSGKTHDPNCASVRDAQAKLQNLGRWPANLILQHLSGCMQAGTTQIVGNRTDTRPEGDAGRQDKTQWRIRPTEATRRGYSGEDGTETVPVWECAPSCPAHWLDTETGNRPVSGSAKNGRRATAMTGDQSMFGLGGGEFGALYNDAGGASRFFKQVGGHS